MNSEMLGRLVDRHAAALELYARQWCDTPEDVVQEAFLKLVVQEVLPANPAAWLFRVVRNGAINAAKAARRRRRHEVEAGAETSAWFQTDACMANPDRLDPETAASVLGSIPLEQREVIIAHIWGGLTFEQIAEATGSSSSTAHRLYGAGLSTIRERLGVSCRKSRPTQK
jgi:RNA polymerase sigma-70 factor (ECF subfamily)